MSRTDTPLGFIGLGLMGLPIARRLLSAGYAVTVWNRNQEKMQAAEADGARSASCAREVAESSEIVFTCVTDTVAMEAVVFGPDGIASAEGRDMLLVDHCSIHSEAICRALVLANSPPTTRKPLAAKLTVCERHMTIARF